MSNVLARKRGVSALEFYHAAEQMRGELTPFLMNDKYVPKHWRFVFSYPAFEIMRNLFSHMRKANNMYPYSEEQLAERKKYQQKAIDDCDELFDLLQHLMTTLFYLKVDAMHPIPHQLEAACEHLDRTQALLRAWKKSSKVLGEAKAETTE